MRTVSVEQSAGLVLCHDITEIVPGVCKHPAFRRGYRVKEEDIPHLLRLGKKNLFVWDGPEPGLVHEDDAACRIALKIAGPGIDYGAPKEGRINFTASRHGLLRVDLDLLRLLNSVPDMAIATAHTMQEVHAGNVVAGERVIPLTVREENVAAVEQHCCGRGPLLEVLPFKEFRVGIISTDSEVHAGLIQDGFGPVLRKKVANWGSTVISHEIVPDETSATVAALEKTLAAGADMILVTGGMSVDPDDKTPAAIRALGCDVVVYGAPVFPGAMFMLGYKGEVPVFGLPGCVMYHHASILDLVMPRILAGLRVTAQDIVDLAHGGLCLGCEVCHYPNCVFGKG